MSSLQSHQNGKKDPDRPQQREAPLSEGKEKRGSEPARTISTSQIGTTKYVCACHVGLWTQKVRDLRYRVQLSRRTGRKKEMGRRKGRVKP